jgi:site-specific recombinase XerD
MVIPARTQAKETYGFVNDVGEATDLNNVLNRSILPALNAAGIGWHGWHAFRRYESLSAGRSGQTIQAILRHANVSTTQIFTSRL